jgi:hypothetical protein
VTIQDVIAQYEGRLRELEAAIAQFRLTDARSTGMVAIAVGLFLVFGFYTLRGQLSMLWPSLPIPLAAVAMQRLQRARRALSRSWRLKDFYGRSIQRVKGNWVGAGVKGEEFIDASHVYSTDLHLFGEGSLFELLCITRTSIGQRGLADYLLQAPSREEILLRQEAVRELRGRVELRETVATLGKFEFLESQPGTFEEWFSSPRLSFPRFLLTMAGVTSALLAAIVVAGLLGLVPWLDVAISISPLIAFHTAVGLFFRSRVTRMAEALRPLTVETQVLRAGLFQIEREQFESAKLRELARKASNGAASLRKLERLLDAMTQRDKEWFAGVSRVLLVGTQLCMAIEQWRREHEQSLRAWLQAWAEFEALNALAGYAFENPDCAFPEFGDEACFQACELGHPLLPRTACVANDTELTSEHPFYVVSGSNMSGKSTLLRAVGLNAVLAFAGAPVRARALRLSGLSVFASISIVDSLLNGKSKFMAEVDRLRLAIEAASENRPVMFLVDEILSGTNSRDRRIAAEAVVRALVNRGAVGILSTHDLALTEIANADGMSGVNVHMGARSESDPLDFDYRLKLGVTQEANALAIARLAGVPV